MLRIKRSDIWEARVTLSYVCLPALMSVKEMAKGITYDDPIKTRYTFLVGAVTFTQDDILLRLAVSRASVDPHYSPIVGPHPVMS